MVSETRTNPGNRERRAQTIRLSRELKCGPGQEPEDLAQLFPEQVGPVQRLVGLLDLGQLELLARGQILGVLPKGESGTPELPGHRGLPAPPGGFPDLLADLVENLGGPGDDMEGIQTEPGVKAALRYHPGQPARPVGAHQGDGRAPLSAKLIEEAL